MSSLNHPHPGTTIRDLVIKSLGLSVTEAAKNLSMSRSALSRVLNGKAGISPDLAIRLEMAGISTARFWIALQSEYDLEQARKKKQSTIMRLMEDTLRSHHT